jgi:hypothetical protein
MELHLFKDCRFMKHLWSEIAVWTANHNLHLNAWPPNDTLLEVVDGHISCT